MAMVEARGAFFDDPDSYTWTYGYDPVGNPVLNRRYPDGTTITATFDQDSRQTTSTRTTDTGMTGDPVRFYYHANSVLARIRYPSNSGDRDELRRIDEAGRLALVANEDPDGGNRISGYAVTRDPAGNPTAVDITGSHAETGTRTYTYDQADRLVAECHATDCDTADTAIEYSYDAVGNRLTSARTGELPGPGVTTYDYDAADQLTETTTTNGDTTTSYGFDADGNLTTAGDLTYTHDVLNRERTRTGPDGTWTTTWDPDSRRMTLYETGTSDSQAFFWDINHPDNLPRLAVQADADNAGRRTWSYQTDGTALDTTTGTIGAELTDLLQTDGDTVGDDRPAAPEIPESDALAIEQAAWLHHDHRGSITDTTDIGTGEPLNRYDYEPFGTRDTIGSDGFDPLLGYTGEYHDPTGNIHLRARQHDPDLGRFTTTDPATHPTDKPFTNTYHYAANNPLIYIDPDGMRESYDGTHTSSSAESQYNIALRLTRTWMTENSEVVYGLGPRLRRGAFPPARYLEWYHKVKPGGEWDYKEYFMETFKESNYDEHMYQIRDCDWLIGMEIFGNIHYGYVGKKWAFLEAELTFAGERVGTGPDAHDRIAMEIGYDLANRYAPHELTEEVIHQEILRRLPDFAAVEPGDLQARRRDPGER